MANRNRTAGIRYELQIAQELRDLGYDNVVSTRSESKRMDDLGVDLIQLPGFILELPFYPQAKKSINTPSVKLLDVDHLEKPLVIFYQRQEKKGKRFYTQGDYVIMKKDFFYKLLKHENIKYK